MESSISIDPSVEEGGPHRALGKPLFKASLYPRGGFKAFNYTLPTSYSTWP